MERINITSSHSHSRNKRSVSSDHPEVPSLELKNLSIYTNYSVEVAAVTIKVGVYSSPKYFLSQQGGISS